MNQNYLKAFKSYDIRWISWTEIDEKFMYILWKWVWEYLVNEIWEDTKILIWCDVRWANTIYLPYFIKWLNENNIKNIAFAKFWNEDKIKYPYWICSTSACYFIWQWDFDIWISITASHNPKEYMWMKFFDKEINLIPSSILKECFEKAYFEDEYKEEISELIDTEYEQELIQSKKEKLYNYLQEKRNEINKSHKIVVDFSTWAWITIEKEFFDRIKDKHNFIHINDYADWEFSAHESDTSERKNYQHLIEKIKQEWADFGIMFDWDVDRIWFVTWDWNVINCDTITSIIANQVLQKQKWDIVFDVMSSKSIEDTAKKYWVNWIRHKTWRIYINQKLDEVNWVLWWEASGHYMFREVWWYEMPLLALYYVLKELDNHDSFQEMIDKHVNYHKTPIISQKTDKKEEIFEKIKEEFKDYKFENIDWLTIIWNDFRCNVRWSNSENKIRFTVEADTKEKWEEIREKIENIINSI